MLNYAAETHRGNIRKLNEDCYEADPEHGLWLVADGVGGHACGDVASELTRATIKSVYHRSGDLVEAIEAAHQAVLAAIKRREGGANMGSTVVAAAIDGHNYQIAWVGDSRAYLWNGKLRLLSTDHSYVEALVAKGVITRAEAFKHPKRNIITQSIGVSADSGLKVDTVSGTLAAGERLLLCSDGLNDELEDHLIADTLGQHISPQQQVKHLLEGALTNGGRDNVTIIVIDPTEKAGQAQAEDIATPSSEQDNEELDMSGHTIVMTAGSDFPTDESEGKTRLGRLFSSIKNKFK